MNTYLNAMDFEEFKGKFEKVPVDVFPNQVPDNPVVSVCVQTYQHAKYIKECLDNILIQQTNFPFEILLGEDESTDGTREICIDYAKRYPDKIRLFLHHRENNIYIGRPSGRFNLLYNLFNAKGKYIAICEGDDYWTDPLKLEKQFKSIQEMNDCKLIGHKAKELSEIQSTPNFKFIKDKIGKIYFREVLMAEYPMHTSSFFFEKSALFPIPLWLTKTFSCDVPIIHVLALNHPIFILDEFMSVYRHNSLSMTKRSKQPSIKASRIILYEALNKLSDRKYNNLLKKLALMHYFKRLRSYFKTRNLTIQFVVQGGYELIRFILK